MKNDLTAIAIVLDRSESMRTCREATITGFNNTLAEQKALPGEALLTLVTFNDKVRTVFSLLPIQEVRPISEETYVPDGRTALFDAMGQTIDAMGRELAGIPEALRPARVIVITMTDGHENASQRYSKSKITEIISHQRTKYAWEFAFLGADPMVVEEARIMGASASVYVADKRGTSIAHHRMSKGLANYRSGGKYGP